jgi:hypothetical protein
MSIYLEPPYIAVTADDGIFCIILALALVIVYFVSFWYIQNLNICCCGHILLVSIPPVQQSSMSVYFVELLTTHSSYCYFHFRLASNGHSIG